ncbi:MAG: FecR domain-containing protein, partial [Verrucomicrobia bacterium]|nr:FecR domain-containing protein [Verrucomicrobiota bacterium]
MLTQELLAAYFADALAPAERVQAELELASDHASQRALADQQLLDQALRVALGGPEADERVKQSVLAVVRASSIEQLRAHVLAETSRRPIEMRSAPANLTPEAKNGVATARWFAAWRTIPARAAAALRFDFRVKQRLAIAAVLLVAALGIYFIKAGSKLLTHVKVGEFAVAVGNPAIRRAGERSTLNAQRSTSVCFGDRIETGDADRAEIQFRDGTTLRLHFNTVVEIPNPQSEISNTKLRPPEINLLRGQVWTKVQKLTNAPQYAVRTPVATAIARGTEFGL